MCVNACLKREDEKVFQLVERGDSSLCVLVQHPYLCVIVFKDWNSWRKQIFIGDLSHEWDKTGKKQELLQWPSLTSQLSPSVAGNLWLSSAPCPCPKSCLLYSDVNMSALPQTLPHKGWDFLTQKVGWFSSLLWEAEGFLQEAVPNLLREPSKIWWL